MKRKEIGDCRLFSVTGIADGEVFPNSMWKSGFLPPDVMEVKRGVVEMTNTRWIIALGVLVSVGLPADAVAATPETYINISGTATGGGTITVELKELNGQAIGSYTYTAAVGDNYEDVAKGLKDSGNIPGYTDSKGNAKTEGGVRYGVFKIKVKRGGGNFTVNVTEDIPGISWTEKATYHETRRMTVESTVRQGSTGSLNMLGVDTTWLADDITGLDFGVGITVDSFTIQSDSLIAAQVTVASDGPLGPEHVDVIGNAIDDNGNPDLGIFLDSSTLPLTVVSSSGAIPTVSEWGLVVMVVMLLTAGTVILGRRRQAAVA